MVYSHLERCGQVWSHNLKKDTTRKNGFEKSEVLPKGVMRFVCEKKQMIIGLLCLEDFKKEGEGGNCKSDLRAR